MTIDLQTFEPASLHVRAASAGGKVSLFLTVPGQVDHEWRLTPAQALAVTMAMMGEAVSLMVPTTEMTRLQAAAETLRRHGKLCEPTDLGLWEVDGSEMTANQMMSYAASLAEVEPPMSSPTIIKILCPTCTGTGSTATEGHGEGRQETCPTCGGTGSAPARTGETAETSFRP